MKESLGPLPVLSVLRDRRAMRRVAAVTIAFAVAGFVYGLVAPKWYRPALTIVPVSPSRSSGFSNLLGSELGGLAAGMAAMGGASADAARIVAVLQSNSVTDGAIEKFDLMTRFGAKYQESAREEVWRRCEARVLPKPNLIQLACEDTDPRFAQELLSFLAERGNQVFRRVSRSSESEEVRFLEARAAELRQQADETAGKVREFQEAHQLVDLEAQARAVVTEVAALNKQRILKQMELGYARTYSSPDEATTRQLESQLSVVDEKLLDLETKQPRPSSRRAPGGASAGDKPGMFPAAIAVPQLRADYEKLYRDRKVAEATLVYVLERLEGAKAAEARNVSTFQVLDPPGLATRKSKPFRLLILIGATLLGFAGSLAFEWWRAGGRDAVGRVLRSRPPQSREGQDSSKAG